MFNYLTPCTCEVVTSQVFIPGPQQLQKSHHDCVSAHCNCALHAAYGQVASGAPWTSAREIMKNGGQRALISSDAAGGWGAFAYVWLNVQGDTRLNREGHLNVALILASPKFLALSKQIVANPEDKTLIAKLAELVIEAETLPTFTNEYTEE